VECVRIQELTGEEITMDSMVWEGVTKKMGSEVNTK